MWQTTTTWLDRTVQCTGTRLVYTVHQTFSLVPRPYLRGKGLVTFNWFLGLHWNFIATVCKFRTDNSNVCTKKVPCHCAEVAKNFQCCNHIFVFCNVIGGWKILRRKQSMLKKPELVKCHQILPFLQKWVWILLLEVSWRKTYPGGAAGMLTGSPQRECCGQEHAGRECPHKRSGDCWERCEPAQEHFHASDLQEGERRMTMKGVNRSDA